MIKNKKGFTLIETLLYVFIFSLLMVAIFSFNNAITSFRNHSLIILEVKDQGIDAIKTITDKIHSAISINSPTASSSAEMLSLGTSNPLTNPTIFSVSGGVLYVTEGGGDIVALTNNKVYVSDLFFSNLSMPSTPGIIRIRFKLSNVSQSQGSNYSSSFYGSASIR